MVNLTGITMTGPVDSLVPNTGHHSDYQVLYELPLVTMTESGALPAVAPVQPIILYRGDLTIPFNAHQYTHYAGIPEKSLIYKLLTLPMKHLFELWCRYVVSLCYLGYMISVSRCVNLLYNLSPWQLPLMCQLVQLIEQGLKAGPW